MESPFYLQLAKYAGKPLAYYGRSFGPFPITTKSNRDFKKLSLEMLHYFSFLSIRDSKTEKISSRVGIRLCFYGRFCFLGCS